jgi:serine-type D-Ala-D-Ala carboxypeptidase (penicillin-binding protein 5/6)
VDQAVSKMFLEVGQQVPVKQLLYGMMVSSGNDAAMALGEYLGGREESFVAMMNEHCRHMGLNETRFGSPDGMPEPDQYTTVADMVKLAGLLLRRFPNALEYTSVKEYTFDKITQRNWNTLLFYDARVDGIKTGHVNEAGFHLVATAHQDNVRLISAVMGTPTPRSAAPRPKSYSDQGLGPDNPDRAQDGRKEPIQPDQQQAVRFSQL